MPRQSTPLPSPQRNERTGEHYFASIPSKIQFCLYEPPSKRCIRLPALILETLLASLEAQLALTLRPTPCAACLC